MRILHLISVGYASGGAETYLYQLIQAQKHAGHQVMVVSSDISYESSTGYADMQFRAIRPGLLARLVDCTYNVSAYRVVRNSLKSFCPEVVHIHTIGELSPLILLLLKPYPVVMTLHGHETFIDPLLLWCLSVDSFRTLPRSHMNLNMKGKLQFIYFRFIQRQAYKRWIRHIDLFISPSDWLRRLAEPYASPGVTLPHGIVPLGSAPQQSQHNLLYVGRLTHYKGVDVLIRAFTIAAHKNPQLTLDIVGDGEMRPVLMDLIRSANLTQRVKFHGWIPHDQLGPIYHQSSVVVIPSVVPESFCLAGVEALSAGRPVIASNIGGIPTWLKDRHNGLFCDPGNVKDLADKILFICGDRRQLDILTQGALESRSDFSMERHARLLHTQYEKTIQKYISLR